MQYLITGSTIITIANIANVRIVESPDTPPEEEYGKRFNYAVDATEAHANRRHTLYLNDNPERCDAFLEAYTEFLNTANKVVTLKEIYDRMRPIRDYYILCEEREKADILRLVFRTARDTFQSQLEILAEENGLTPDWDGIQALINAHDYKALKFYRAYKRANLGRAEANLSYIRLDREIYEEYRADALSEDEFLKPPESPDPQDDKQLEENTP